MFSHFFWRYVFPFRNINRMKFRQVRPCLNIAKHGCDILLCDWKTEASGLARGQSGHDQGESIGV
jgi:hypothetical protein